jgi:hypothetical protein
MADTLANILDLTKQVWTQNRLEKQFYNKNNWLDKVTKTNKYSIGNKAFVPTELSLPGGTSSFPSTGATLNAADALHVDRAEYDLTYHAQQVEVQIAALAHADSVGVRSTVDQLDQMISSNVDALRRDINRQAVSAGDALIAECTTTSTSDTVELDPDGYGYDAIRRGWLRPGLLIDIGTAANEVSEADARSIESVDATAATPSITISGADVSTAASDFVSVANARAGTTSYEADGLRKIVGTTGNDVGSIDGATVPEWNPAHVDTTTTLVSLDLLLSMQSDVFQQSGEFPTYVTTSPKQMKELYQLAQTQVRFESDSSTAAGNAHSFKWNGLTIEVDPQIPDRELYMLTLDDFFVVTGGKFDKPTWASDMQGANTGLLYTQGGTSFKDSLFYFCELGVKRRNRAAAAVGLTA